MRNQLFFLLIVLTGCFQAYSEEDELRTIPVTNNPHVVPNHSSAIPGMPLPSQGPY